MALDDVYKTVWVTPFGAVAGGTGGGAAIAVGANGALMVGGGSGFSASGVFTPVAGAYGAGDIVQGAKEFTPVYADGSGVQAGSVLRVLSVAIKNDVTSVPAGQTSFTLQAYVVTPPSAQADNALWSLASADLAPYRGSIAAGTPQDLGAACYVRTGDVNMDIKLTGASLWLVYVTAGAATLAAVDHQVFLYGIVL